MWPILAGAVLMYAIARCVTEVRDDAIAVCRKDERGASR